MICLSVFYVDGSFTPHFPPMSVQHLSAEPTEVVVGMRSPGNKVTDGCILPHGLGMVSCFSERAASAINYLIIS